MRKKLDFQRQEGSVFVTPVALPKSAILAQQRQADYVIGKEIASLIDKPTQGKPRPDTETYHTDPKRPKATSLVHPRHSDTPQNCGVEFISNHDKATLQKPNPTKFNASQAYAALRSRQAKESQEGYIRFKRSRRKAA